MNTAIGFQSLKPIIFNFPTIPTRLNISDYIGAIKVRWGIGRNNYTVSPGLYKVGNPNSKSDVFVSANYKLSFDILRKNLDSLNAWILVIDTNGVNVWCAAGKGTFATENLVKSIKKNELDKIVNHRSIIVPQLGAVGVAAHKVKEQSGFKVIYGPIHAKDIKPFIQNGYKASPEMRNMKFPIWERVKLIPNDFMYGKYKILLALFIMFVLSGLDKTGFLFSKMIGNCIAPIANVFGAYVAGIVFSPLLLPYIPFRAFALKGAFWGVVSTCFLQFLLPVSFLASIALGLLNVCIASFTAMNFTGSSTYTSMSGVKKEMKWAIPFQIVFAFIGLVIFIISRLN